MSREPKNKPAEKPIQPRFNDITFVNWSLNAEQKAACKGWNLSMEDFDSCYAKLIEEGYKVTVSYDNFRGCYTASIVPTKDGRYNQGYILTGKGSTPMKAVKQVLYIHFHVMNGEWAAYSTVKEKEELDD